MPYCRTRDAFLADARLALPHGYEDSLLENVALIVSNELMRDIDPEGWGANGGNAGNIIETPTHLIVEATPMIQEQVDRWIRELHQLSLRDRVKLLLRGNPGSTILE